MVFNSRSSDRASILVVAVPLLTRPKILGIERDLLDCELEVAALPGHGLDDLGGVESVAAEPRAARDADDVAAALRLHLSPDRIGAVEQSADADIDLTRPFLRRERIESDQGHIDGVVHHNIEAAPATHDRLHHAFASGE